MKRIVVLVLLSLIFLSAGCVSESGHWYEVTDKQSDGVNFTLILDDIKTIPIGNYTYDKIDVGDRVKVDDSSNNIVNFQTGEDWEEEKKDDETCVTITVIGMIIFFIGLVVYFGGLPLVGYIFKKWKEREG